MRRQPELRTVSYCAHQAARGNPHIGRATVFVSWGLVSSFDSLLDALKAYMAEHDLDPLTTFFWVCDTCIRQLEGKDVDVPRLGEMVGRCEYTLLFVDVWDRMVAR